MDSAKSIVQYLSGREDYSEGLPAIRYHFFGIDIDGLITEHCNIFDLDCGRLKLKNTLKLCDKYFTAEFCDGVKCSSIHICRDFVFNWCSIDNCENGHSFATRHNACILSALLLDELETSVLKKLIKNSEKSQRTDSIPNVCPFYNNPNGCPKYGLGTCRDIHICGKFAVGSCNGPPTCILNHNISHPDCRLVLDTFGISFNDMAPREVVTFLKEHMDNQTRVDFENGNYSDPRGVASGAPRSPSNQQSADNFSSENVIRLPGRTNRPSFKTDNNFRDTPILPTRTFDNNTIANFNMSSESMFQKPRSNSADRIGPSKVTLVQDKLSELSLEGEPAHYGPDAAHNSQISFDSLSFTSSYVSHGGHRGRNHFRGRGRAGGYRGGHSSPASAHNPIPAAIKQHQNISHRGGHSSHPNPTTHGHNKPANHGNNPKPAPQKQNKPSNQGGNPKPTPQGQTKTFNHGSNPKPTGQGQNKPGNQGGHSGNPRPTSQGQNKPNNQSGNTKPATQNKPTSQGSNPKPTAQGQSKPSNPKPAAQPQNKSKNQAGGSGNPKPITQGQNKVSKPSGNQQPSSKTTTKCKSNTTGIRLNVVINNTSQKITITKKK